MLITHKSYNSDFNYRKISKTEFVNTKTGELITVDSNNNTYRSISSLRRSFFKLSLLIYSNFFGDKSEVFISLTYNKRTSDYNRLNGDIKNFWAKFQRYNKKPIPYRCLIVIEYQKSGNPHLHLLLKRLDGEAIDLSKDFISKIWNNGSVDIQNLYDVNGLVDYLNPFKVTKKLRSLKYYKKCMQIYRCCGLFDRMKKSSMTYENVLNLAKENNFTEIQNGSYEVIETSNDKLANIITIKKLKKLKEL